MPPLLVHRLPRHDWTREEVRALFALPFPELMFHAARVHRENFDPAKVQISTLLSIKTGGCPEDCAYCPQSAKFDTGVKAEKLMDLDAAVGQDRWLPRGLCVLPAIGEIRHRRQGRKGAGSRYRSRRGARGKSRRCLTLLHGCGVALAERP